MSDRPSGLIELASEFSDLRLDIDPISGAPRRLWRADAPDEAIGLAGTLAIEAGGEERLGLADDGIYPPWHLSYVDTHQVLLAGASRAAVVTRVELDGRDYVVTVGTTRPSDWSVRWHYRFGAAFPRLAVRVELLAASADAIARGVELRLDVALADPTAWRIQAPGNMLRPDLPLERFSGPVAVSPAGGVDGSAGLVALEHPRPATAVLWPFSRTEIGAILLEPVAAGVRLTWDTWVAGQPGAGGSLFADALHLDLVPTTFADVLAQVPDGLARLGISGPESPPEWAAGASIYEVQIGFSVFQEGYRYSPYPTVGDLLDDLDRIADLGYDTLQIMPRQPYPSYNVHDYADITGSYGDEAVLKRLVEACHARGMHVILDVLMHGVVDGEVVSTVVEGIESSPWGPRLDEALGDMTTEDLGESDAPFISWCQHLVNFGPHWVEGSPWRHPLLDEHPEWFYRDSAGNVTGTYTRAFDASLPAWQRYFIDAALAFVDRLDIDGFRIDAPSYNTLHDWSERTRQNAAAPMLGCLAMFRQLRTELLARKPDALLYTEPSGSLYRESMDVTYNYDELWLIRAIMEQGAGRDQWVQDAHDLGRWFAQRDATLPRGSLTAHHVDSHDTFWWPRPGHKWRREQYGAEATAAMMSVLTLSGGPYMTFVGGEIGIEDRVRSIHRLRAEHPVFARGTSDYENVEADDRHVYAVLRTGADEAGIALVNLSARASTTRISLRAGAVSWPPPGVTPDLLGGVDIEWRADREQASANISLQPYQAAATVIGPGRGR